MDIITAIIVGAIAGWLASTFMRGHSMGMMWNIILGIAGAVVGDWLFGLLQLSASGLAGNIAMATIGAAILLYIIPKFTRM
ncbi:MAG: GlsB/YeaQ/YmgE family stress response membrane protein [Chitinophagales bacterium]